MLGAVIRPAVVHHDAKEHMSAIERLILLLIGMLSGCALTLVVLGLPLAMDEPQLATTYFTAASIVGFIALGGGVAVSAIKRKRAPGNGRRSGH
jgi:hypothetical protein